MKFCHHCGNQLSLGTEKYCPECGEGLTTAPASAGSSSTGTKIYGTATDIAETSGDVIGSTVTGTGNIIGKDVEYSVSGSVINLQVNSISTDILQELKDIISRPVQLETKSSIGGQTRSINTELTDVKASEAKMTKEKTSQVLKDIDQIAKEKSIRIDQVRIGAVQFSRTELMLRDIMLEGNDHYYKGEYSKAIQCYDRALKIDDKHYDAWVNKGTTLHDLGKYEEARTNKDDDFYYMSRYEEAIKCYDRALKINDKYVYAWAYKGGAFISLGVIDPALYCCDRALELDDKYVYAWNIKGNALYYMGRYEEALKCYDRVLELDDKYVDAWYNKGYALKKLGKHKEAEEYHNTAKKLG